jgi:hypothetical protein
MRRFSTDAERDVPAFKYAPASFEASAMFDVWIASFELERDEEEKGPVVEDDEW